MADFSRSQARALPKAHRTIGPMILRRLRPAILGREAVPAEGPVILASNHVSYVDNYLLSSATPRPPWFLGKAELAVGWFGRLNRALGMIPVQRGRGDWAAIEIAIELLRGGEIVALFPEGTRSPTGELFKFRSGMARIAVASGASVLPVGLRGTRDYWPPGVRPPLRRPHAGALEVRYGELLDPPPQDSPRARREFTAEVRDAVADLSRQTRAEGYAPVEKPAGDVDRPSEPAVSA